MSDEKRTQELVAIVRDRLRTLPAAHPAARGTSHPRLIETLAKQSLSRPGLPRDTSLAGRADGIIAKMQKYLDTADYRVYSFDEAKGRYCLEA